MSNVLQFLSSNKSMIIPDYQRNYCWEKAQCEELFDDLVSTMETRQNHYLGSIICLTDKNENKKIIDGQQRLTTLSLLILATIQVAKTNIIKFNTEANYYCISLEDTIFNSNGNKKLHLKRSNDNSRDSEDYHKVIQYVLPEINNKNDKKCNDNGKRIQKSKNELLSRMATNFNYFYDRITEYAKKQSAPDIAGENLYHGFERLFLSDLELKDNSYDPQQVFESMNATGQELTEFDKCRNYFLITTSNDENELIETWQRLENNIQDSRLRDKFMFAYLKMFSRIEFISRKNILHETDYYRYIKSIFKFKNEQLTSNNEKLTKVTFLKDVANASIYFRRMIEGTDRDKSISQSLKRLSLSDNTQFWPVILCLYKDREKNIITDSDFASALNTIESYIFRRQVCALDSKSSKTLIDQILTSFKRSNQNKAKLVISKILSTNKESAKMPTDTEFKNGLDKLSYRDRRKLIESILLAIEYQYCSDAKTEPTTCKCSIEHILPETERLSDDWRNELRASSPDKSPEQIQKDWCHKLGNLTLLEIRYNNAYQDKTYSAKLNFTIKNDDGKNICIGYRNCSFQMTRELARSRDNHWTESKISKRHKKIINTCLKLWPYPDSSNLSIIDDEQFLTYTMDEKLDRKEFENRTFSSFSILNTKFKTHDYQVLLLDILTYLEDDHAQQLYDLVNQNIENGVPLLITDKENNIPWPDHNIYLLLPRRSKNYTYNFINRLKPILEACNVNLSDIEFSLV